MNHINIPPTVRMLKNFSDKDDNEKSASIIEWFSKNFECPAFKQYDEGDESYLNDWNNGYDIIEHLQCFNGHIKDELLEKIAAKLAKICPNWRRKMSYDELYLDSILSEVDYYNNFISNIESIKNTLNTDLPKNQKDYILKLLYINIITSIETYLLESFITQIFTKGYRRNFVEKNKDFQERKINLSEIYSKYENIDNEIKDYLFSLMWHNLEKIKKLFEITLSIKFPSQQIMSPIFKAINIRHDLVHRNGKNKKGHKITITENEIINIIEKSKEFIDHLNQQLETTDEEKTDELLTKLMKND